MFINAETISKMIIMDLKITGISMVGLTALLLLPSSFSMLDTDEVNFWGAANMVSYDSEGNEILSQKIHNRIVDTGEEFILDQVFQDTATSADNVQIATICAFENSTSSVSVREGIVNTDLDGDNTINDDDRCIEDTAVTTTGGQGIIGALTFTGGTNVANGDTIHGIGICQASSANDTYRNCQTQGILFAIVDTSDVTLNAAETVDITYTFDLSSGTT